MRRTLLVSRHCRTDNIVIPDELLSRSLNVKTGQAAFPSLKELVQLFYDEVEELASFEECSAASMPEPYRSLLAHNHHMTVTVESFHNSLVDVKVLEYRLDHTYERKILLSRQSDDVVVMFGIVRLHTQFLAESVQKEIESRQTPLGRILIEHNVLRRVELGRLWRVTPNLELQRHFNLDSPKVTFGRTAIIHCDEEPAIELVEIVSPESS